MFFTREFANTLSTKALSDFATLHDSQPTPAWLMDTVFARSCQVLNVTALHSKELKMVICLLKDSSVETQYLVG